jgi:predicted phage terminase large subunit-like protein
MKGLYHKTSSSATQSSGLRSYAVIKFKDFDFSKPLAEPDPEAKATTGEPLAFADFIRKVNPRYKFYAHAEQLVKVLQRVADGELKRLMVFMPPRHSKSETVSRLFTAYYLYRHPEKWVAITSYGDALARTMSRASQANFTEAGGLLNPDATAVTHWETTSKGGMWATGVGGPATGRGFDLGIVDDPVKNAEEAASETLRAKQKEWWQSTFSTREEPDGAIVVIQTRWHGDDLAGWLLAQEAGEQEEPERWHIVHMPAIAEAPPTYPPTCTVEPDLRQPGEALCPERYNEKKLGGIAKRVGPYFWAALFQQRPAPRQGDFFQRAWFGILRAMPTGCRFVRYWDKAGSSGKGDFSVGALLAMTPEGRCVVVDVVRGQWNAGQREAVIRQTAEMDRDRYGHVTVWLEQEPGSGGKESAENSVRNLAGFAAHAAPVTGDKAVRATPLAAQAQAHNVDLLAGVWNAPFLDEIAAFPNGAHDDQVDAAAGAFNKLNGAGKASVDFV